VGGDLGGYCGVTDNEFDDMIPILGGGTFFFIVLVPAALFRKRS